MLSTLSLMSHKGDEVIVEWDNLDEKGKKKAAKAFQKLRDAGCVIYKVEHEEHNVIVPVPDTITARSKGEQVHSIEELETTEQTRLIARPAMAGG